MGLFTLEFFHPNVTKIHSNILTPIPNIQVKICRILWFQSRENTSESDTAILVLDLTKAINDGIRITLMQAGLVIFLQSLQRQEATLDHLTRFFFFFWWNWPKKLPSLFLFFWAYTKVWVSPPWWQQDCFLVMLDHWTDANIFFCCEFLNSGERGPDTASYFKFGTEWGKIAACEPCNIYSV